MKRFQIIILALFTAVINMSFLMPMSVAQAASPPSQVSSTTSSTDPCDSTNLIGGTGTSTTTTTSVKCQRYSTDSKSALYLCAIDANKSGVLIAHPIIGSAGNMGVFTCYVVAILDQNLPFVMLIATLLIIGSGLLYMLSGGSPGELTKAKQRIGGILGGVALYFLIRFLVPIIANGLTL